MAWFDVAAATELAGQGKLVVRHEGRQILLLQTPAGMSPASIGVHMRAIPCARAP